MKFLLVLVALLFPSSLVAQKKSALEDMVQTEQEFSKTAEEKNTRDAFMTFIADDGILIRLFPVNGKKWMLENPVKPSDKKPLLAWQPAFAGMAAAGDLGFTTGPWEFKADIKDEKPSGYGHFVTLWKKQLDGTWRFVLDLGIPHPQSGGPQTLWQPPAEVSETKNRNVQVETARKALLQRDRAFSSAGLKRGYKAFVSFAAPDVRLYRTNNLPFIGRAASAKYLETAKENFVWTPRGGDVSRSGDLGYTYGTYIVADPDAVTGHPEQGSYARIWKNDGAGWRVVLDVTNPLPPPGRTEVVSPKKN